MVSDRRTDLFAPPISAEDIVPTQNQAGGLSMAAYKMRDVFLSWAGLSEEEVEKRIYELQNALLDNPNFDPDQQPPLIHHFAPDIYMREIRMPAGDLVIGAKHKTEHFNIIMTGSCLLLVDGELVRVDAPRIIKSAADVKKVLLIEQDMTWVTVHANPTEERNIDNLEDMLTNEPPHKLHADARKRLAEARKELS